MSTRRTRVAAATAVAAAIAASGFAFTAGNTVPASRAGDGAGTVSGYVVDSVHYALDATDPGQVDAVTFELDATPAAGSTVQAKLAAASSTWYSCTWSGTSVSCATTAPQALVASIDELRVVIAD
jgi:hypothetical protein